VLPVLGAGDFRAAPDYLSRQSFANLRDQDYAFELQRLVETIKKQSGDDRIKLSRRSVTEAATTRTAANSVVLEFGERLAPVVNGENKTRALAAAYARMMYEGLFYEIGVQFPKFRVRISPELAASRTTRIVVNGVPERELEIPADSLMVTASVADLGRSGIQAKPVINPANGHKCAWISLDRASLVDELDLTSWNAQEYLILELSCLLRSRAADFIGTDYARAMLKQIEPVFPLLVAETVPKTVPLFVFTDVLRRLVAEQASIRNLRKILMVLAEWGRIEQDPTMLTEYVRAALSRELSMRQSRNQYELTVFLVDPQIEGRIRTSMRHTAVGSYLDLEPAEIMEILSAFRAPLETFPNLYQLPCILTTMEVRSVIRRMITPSFPHANVLAYQEVHPEMDLRPLGRISLKKLVWDWDAMIESRGAA
jgi:type III secretory pathway component EscV